MVSILCADDAVTVLETNNVIYIYFVELTIPYAAPQDQGLMFGPLILRESQTNPTIRHMK